MRKFSLVFLLVFIGCSCALAQGGGFNSLRFMSGNQGSRMFDEEEKPKYGPQNTRFTFEKNFKFNTLIFQNPDTLPNNLHRFSDLESSNYTIQNLGNIGTARRSMFFDPTDQIGRTSGYNAYNHFYTSPDKIRYFDTRSPFTDVYAAFGGGGRAHSKVLFTLNDSIQFNIGFNINSIRSDKQLAFLQRGDRNVKSTDWNVFGFLRPVKIPKYLLLFNLTQFNHEVTELGGITEAVTSPTQDTLFYDYLDEDVILDNAQSSDKRGGFHIFQQYDLDSIIQVYHSATYMQQILRYQDDYNLTTSDSLIYSPISFGQTTGEIRDRSKYTEFENEIGLKGLTKKFAYTLFYKNRILSYQNVNDAVERDDIEHYLGGTLRQRITSKVFLVATGSYLFGDNYFVQGEFSSSLFDATFKRVNRRASYLQTRHIGQQINWDNSFENEVSDNLSGRLKLRTKRIGFEPFVKVSRISNFFYFNDLRRPDQANGDIFLLTAGADLNVRLSNRWTWSNTVYSNSVSGSSSGLYRIPSFMALTQLAYTNVLFDGKMMIQTGADVHYRSKYFGYAYTPITQQFYLQNDFEVDAAIKVDLFLNFKVQNFIFFIKSSNFTQGLINDGYFISPFFTGPRRTTDVGIRWSFFD